MLAAFTSNLGARVLSTTLALSLSVALTGCSLFNKRPGANGPSQAGGVPPARFPASGDPTTGGAANPPTAFPTNTASNSNNPVGGAMLAGRVIDGFSRPPVNTSIRLVSLDDKSPTEQEVAVTPEGYFTIQGLKSGGRYKLLARGKQGDRFVAGTSYFTAPNIRALIQVKEDYAGIATPSLPQHPGAATNDQGKTSLNTAPPGWNGYPGAFPGAGSEHALPTSINVSPQGTPASAAPPANNWTAGPGLAQQNTMWPPTLEVPRAKQATTPPPASLQIPNVPPPVASPPSLDAKSAPAFPIGVQELIGQARIPSCVRVGDRIVNFALNDLNGERWELRQRKGKLVLVDFWFTDCPPCKAALPHLRDLQAKFGGQGLEIVGIAYEKDGTREEQAYQVLETCRRHGVYHRQLLGSGPDCPVRKEFRVRMFPSVFLLDEQGNILWRNEGYSPEQSAELERLIGRRLTNRAF